MVLKQVKQSFAAYLHLQANRCQQLSRSCVDPGSARELRLMAEEYSVTAASMEEETSVPQSQPCTSVKKVTRSVEPTIWGLVGAPTAIAALAGTSDGAAIRVVSGALIAEPVAVASTSRNSHAIAIAELTASAIGFKKRVM
jgi:hypothetical protein